MNKKLTMMLSKVERAREQINRLEAALEEARKSSRRTLLEASEAGLTQQQLADQWKTSQARMRENIIRARAERALNG
jgi:TPP-dependent trihydroxycyclohexane-1,2-dione (THcHDO) dehydratase